MIPSPFLFYPLLGLFSGLMAGLFGVGGGIIVVPGLVFLFQNQNLIAPEALMQTAIGTSLAAMVITTQASVRAHNQIGQLNWSLFNRLWPGLISGAVVGALINALTPTQWLEAFFGVFLLCVALKIAFAKTPSRKKNFPNTWLNHVINFFIGPNSGLLGVGGGILMVPYLNSCGVALVGTVIYCYAGAVNWPAVLLIGLFSSFSAPLGARLSYRLPVNYLRYGFVFLLLLTAFKMLL